MSIAGSTGAEHPVWLPDGRHILAMKDSALWVYDTQQFAAPVFIAGPLSVDAVDIGIAGIPYYGHTRLSRLVAVG